MKISTALIALAIGGVSAHAKGSVRGSRSALRGKQRFVVVTDAGNFGDDFWALSFLFSHREQIDIQYVLASTGDADSRLSIVTKYLYNFGDAVTQGVPIGMGTVSSNATSECLTADPQGYLVAVPCDSNSTQETFPDPLLRPWAENMDLSSYSGTIYNKGNEGLDHLKKVLNDVDPDGIPTTLLVICAPTDVARILDDDPDILRRNNINVVLMGGTLTPGGNEFNFGANPNATNQVLKAAKNPVVVTAALGPDTVMSTEQWLTVLSGDSSISLSQTNVDLALANLGTHKEVCNGRTDWIFDGAAAVASTRWYDEWFSMRQMDVSVERNGVIVEDSSGDGASMTLIDGFQSQGAANAFREELALSVA